TRIRSWCAGAWKFRRLETPDRVEDLARPLVEEPAGEGDADRLRVLYGAVHDAPNERPAVDPRHEPVQNDTLSVDRRERPDRDLAAALEGAQERTLRGRRGGRLRVLERGDEVSRRLVVFPNGDAKGALAHGRQPGRRLEDLAHCILEAQSPNARAGEDDRVVAPLAEARQAGVEIAPQITDDQVRTAVEELGPSPERARPDRCPGGQRFEGFGGAGGRDVDVAGVLTLEHGAQGETVRQARRDILQRMHRRVHLAGHDGTVDLLREKPLVPDPGKGHVGDPVAGGVQDPDLDPEAGVRRLEPSLDVLGLPQREAAPP